MAWLWAQAGRLQRVRGLVVVVLLSSVSVWPGRGLTCCWLLGGRLAGSDHQLLHASSRTGSK